MEKRKFKANDYQDLKKSSEQHDSYTFVIPNSSIEDIHISIKSKEKQKKEKKKQS